MNRRDYRYIVLGLGGIGSGAAYWLARTARHDVLGIEQFDLDHVRGGSQDHSRIIRLSYHTPGYVRLAQDAYAALATLEVDSGEPLILRTGGLDLEPAHAAISLDDYIASMTACAVSFEVLDAGEIRRRWPQFHVTDDVRGLFQAEGGIAPAARCNAAHRRMAIAHGATLRDNLPVRQVRDLGGEIEVVTDDGIFHCERLIVAGGAWTNQVLASFGMRLPLTVTQEQVTYFQPANQQAFAPERFPVWIWMDDPSFYGFPAYGETAVKVAQDVGGRPVTAETRSFDPDAENLARVQAFMRQVLPGALGPILYTKTCLYTLTPDRDFIIDRVPEHPNVALAVGAGHAFKYASVIGKLLAGLAGVGSIDTDLAPFAADRAILREANPATNYLV